MRTTFYSPAGCQLEARRKEATDLDHEKYGDPLVVSVVEVGAVECPPGAVTLTG